MCDHIITGIVVVMDGIIHQSVRLSKCNLKDFDEEKAAPPFWTPSQNALLQIAATRLLPLSVTSVVCVAIMCHISELLKSNQMDDVAGATETPPGVRGQQHCRLKKVMLALMERNAGCQNEAMTSLLFICLSEGTSCPWATSSITQNHSGDFQRQLAFHFY